MKENQMHLINKMFNSETIRTVWNREEQKYYISVVDVVGVLKVRMAENIGINLNKV